MSKRTRRKAATPEPSAPAEKSLRTTWRHWLFFGSGWLVSLLLGLLDLPEKIVSFGENGPKAREYATDWVWNYRAYSGRFSSDASAWTEKNLVESDTPDVDTGEIQLDIAYRGAGLYEGEIHSAILADKFFAPWSRVSISGSVGVSGAFTGEVWDIVSNERRAYAGFQLSIDDPTKGTLRLTPASEDDGIFLGELVLWPTRREMSGGVPGRRFQEALKRAAD